ncbi:hypothetical protein J2X97_002194 [Epilithonimonas hungarica]|uniref:3-coathanger stack domain-containing protein n=1 Tax=Epilithonimonas hungarica TaxID=454006 RepID=UPI00278A38D2|nr:3-coathanger stack domain-containing protein [Epilithonimonas hungarica]MDP9956535.1 hypothetical protein [Epilithonimonas hungarica]
MEKLIVIIFCLFFYFIKSQELRPFRPAPFPTAQCNNLMGNYSSEWRPSHGSPNVLDLGCGNKVVRLYSKNENISTRKSEGIFIDLNNIGITLDTSKKYKIIVSYRYSLPNNQNRAINFDVYFANNIVEKSNNNCDEEVLPNVSDKMKVLTFNSGEFLTDSYTCQVKSKEQGQISPNKSYKYLWITSNLNTTLNFREYVDIDKIEMYYDTSSGNNGGNNGSTCNLPSPNNLSINNITSTTASFTWNSVSNAIKYRVKVYPKANPNYTNTLETTSNTYNFSNLSPNILYQAEVRAVCSTSNSSTNISYITFTTSTSCLSDLIINNLITNSQTFQASNSILAYSNINNNLIVNYSAGNQISLLPGFNVKATASSLFRAHIKPCSNSPSIIPEEEYPEDTISLQRKYNEAPILNSKLKIYPNPASNILTIDNGKEKLISWQLYDVSGKLMKNGNSNTVNVQSIPNASYVLKINLEKNQISKTIIVKH